MPRSRSRSPARSRSERYRERGPRGYRDDRRDGDSNSYRDGRQKYNRDEDNSHSREDKRGDTCRLAVKEGDEGNKSLTKRKRSRSKSKSRSPSVDKTKPNFNPSGLLAAATNTVTHEGGKATVLKYNEPPEARKPTQSWRLYVFKGEEESAVMAISRQSAYLVGRDRLVADILLEHPSCSKQHAAIQYRKINSKDEFGNVKGSIKPYIIDLESTNGTYVNGDTLPSSRYYELKTGDVIKFGLSNREYVLLLEQDP